MSREETAGDRDRLLSERDDLIALCTHYDGEAWWSLQGVNVAPGDCATEFGPTWQRHETYDDAARAALEAGRRARDASARPATTAYSRPECTFNYCPNPDLCRGEWGCVNVVLSGPKEPV